MNVLEREGRRAVLMAIHDKWFSPYTAGAVLDAIWANQDGYGIPGYTPPQGHDWSGIRDSSDEGLCAMWAAIEEAER